MKLKNWRQYYGYRPTSLAELGRLTDIDIRRQESAYFDWLISAGKVTLDSDLKVHVEAEARSAVEKARQNLEKLQAKKSRRTGEDRELYWAAERALRNAEKHAEEVADRLRRDLRRAAETYARRHVVPEGGLISAVVDRESNVREIEWLHPRCTIRTVRNVSGSAKEIFDPGYEGGKWRRFKTSPRSWNGDLPHAKDPTTYAVIIDGKCVNLSKPRAREWATAQLIAAQ